jgi:hypothetical protein
MPNELELREGLRPFVRVFQIIVACFCASFMFFASIAYVLGASQGPADQGLGVLTIMAIVFWLADLPACFFVTQSVVKYGRQKVAETPGAPPPPQLHAALAALGDAGRMAGIYQIKTIFLCAALEMPVLFGCLAAIREKSMLALCIPALNLVGLVLLFPNVERVARWVEGQMKLIAEERSLGLPPGASR